MIVRQSLTSADLRCLAVAGRGGRQLVIVDSERSQWAAILGEELDIRVTCRSAALFFVFNRFASLGWSVDELKHLVDY